MTRLGFLLGEKVTEVQPGDQYNMEVQDENQVNWFPINLVKYGMNQPIITRKGEMLLGVGVNVDVLRTIPSIECLLRPGGVT